MIEFDQKSPIYLQLAEFIRSAILAGDLPEETAIPSVRQMAVDHNLNPQTVLNATQLLIQEGLLEKRRGLGYFVRADARESLRARSLEEFRLHTIPDLVATARRMGISAKDLIALIQNAYGKESS